MKSKHLKLNAKLIQELYFALEYNMEHDLGDRARNERQLSVLENMIDENRTDLSDEDMAELFMVLLENDISRFNDQVEWSCRNTSVFGSLSSLMQESFAW